MAARGGVDAYVHRSVVNAAISRWRRARRFVPVEDPAEVAPVSERLLEDELVDADVAWKLCGELPPDQRAAVVLRYYEDYSYARIAAVLGCREATARSHVHRAMTTLRARLVGDDHD